VLPHFLGDPDPGLARYEITPAPPRRDVWLLVHRDLRQAPLVRAVMGFLAECINSKRQS
jgi:DNA-binding transcriptional LysR family regulator